MAELISGHPPSLDTYATLLLCAKLGRSEAPAPAPLNVREYHQLVRWLGNADLHLADLLDPQVRVACANAGMPLDMPRLEALVERTVALTARIAEWTNQGLWIISPVDAAYPRAWLAQPHFSAPSLVYGAGNLALLSAGGLAIVGSRNADDQGLEVTRLVARTCVAQDIVVISGGAHGVDNAAMDAAMAAGGG